MKTYFDHLPQIDQYIEKHQQEGETARFDNFMRLIRRYKTVDAGSLMLEIGPGTGWFPLLCALQGLRCKGLEISPQLVEHGIRMGREQGLNLEIELGNVEEATLGVEQYDVVIAWSVFEHVERWRTGLDKIYAALKPGGLLLFSSSNKFTLRPIEYKMPFYEWLPDSWRYRLRRAMQGPDIMKLGIDFNQFTYPQLRRVFREIGFKTASDRIEMADSGRMPAPKRALIQAAKEFAPLRHLILMFSEATMFACVK